MNPTQLHYALALQAVPNIGDITAKKLIQHCGSPEAVFKASKKTLFIDLESDEQIVYDFLKKEGKTLLDLIALNCEIPISKAAYLLLNLELKGVVRPLPGKEFELI